MDKSGAISFSLADTSASFSSSISGITLNSRLKEVRSSLSDSFKKIRDLEGQFFSFLIHPEMLVPPTRGGASEEEREANAKAYQAFQALMYMPGDILEQLMQAKIEKHELSKEEYFLIGAIDEFENYVFEHFDLPNNGQKSNSRKKN